MRGCSAAGRQGALPQQHLRNACAAALLACVVPTDAVNWASQPETACLCLLYAGCGTGHVPVVLSVWARYAAPYACLSASLACPQPGCCPANCIGLSCSNDRWALQDAKRLQGTKLMRDADAYTSAVGFIDATNVNAWQLLHLNAPAIELLGGCCVP